MAWSTTPDIHRFAATAHGFLAGRPVEHTVLLTETAYLEARPSPAADQLYGWWRDETGQVAGAFVQAPRHAPVVSLLPAPAIEPLVDELPEPARIGVDGRLVDAVVAAWRRRGIDLETRSRITLHRLRELRHPQPPPGTDRVATRTDRELLVGWFRQLMAAHPDDPSDLEYVVDDPLEYGGITLWEVDGEPVAMAGRSRLVAGMVRLSAVYEAHGSHGYDDAVFVAACDRARRLARDVVVFAGAGDAAAATAYRDLGFEPVLDRVMLGARPGGVGGGGSQ